MAEFRLERRLDEGEGGGTFGRLYDEEGTELCRIVERPWLDNQRKISCIPTGKYQLGFYQAGSKFYPKYRTKFANIGNDRGMIIINDVPGRSHILIHRGNFPTNSWGCLLTNLSVGRGDNGKLRGFASTQSYRRVYEIIADAVEESIHDNGESKVYLEVVNAF